MGIPGFIQQRHGPLFYQRIGCFGVFMFSVLMTLFTWRVGEAEPGFLIGLVAQASLFFVFVPSEGLTLLLNKCTHLHAFICKRFYVVKSACKTGTIKTNDTLNSNNSENLMDTKWVLDKEKLTGEYIAGFVQADGSFSAVLASKTRDTKQYFNISLSFTIVQKEKYKDLILEIQKRFGGIGH